MYKKVSRERERDYIPEVEEDEESDNQGQSGHREANVVDNPGGHVVRVLKP